LESRWREYVRQQSHSGLSIRAFCRRHDLSAVQFDFWKRQIKARDRESAVSSFRPSFVQLSSPAPAGSPPIELELSGGLRLLLRSGCDLQLLARIIQTLEPRPC
jgi:transposase-like protein